MPELDPELSQAYRAAAHPEPSPALDARILAAACQAVSPRRRPAWFGWAVPLSSTAVLVLGLSLLFRMQQDAPETLREAQSPLPQSTRPIERTESISSGTAATVAPSDALPVAKAARNTTVLPAPQPHQPLPATLPERAQADVATEKSKLAEIKSEADAAGLATPPASPAPAAAQANRAEALSAAPAFSQGMRRMKAAVPATQRSTEQSMPAATAKSAAAVPDTPEHWVESIRLLLRQGNIDAARTRLEALRKRYPDFELPPDLDPARCCPLP